MSTEIIESITKNESLNIGLNYKLYTASIIMLAKFIIEKIENIKDKTNAQNKINDICKNLISTYIDLPIDKDNGIIIKKIFIVLKSNITLLEKQDESLFYKRNAKKKIITIIPGIDFRLIYSMLTNIEKQKIWNYLKLLFIATVKLIYSSNKSKIDENIIKVCNNFEIGLMKDNINVNEIKFNPFVGTQNKTIDIIKSFENKEDLNNMFNMLNIDQLFDVSKIKEQLNTLSTDDIKATTDNITNLLGSNDNDVKEVCSTLVTNLIDNLKDNGLTDLYKTLTSVSDNASAKIDHAKLQKTANIMNMFVEKNEENIKNFTKQHGINNLETLKNNPEALLEFAQKCLNSQNAGK